MSGAENMMALVAAVLACLCAAVAAGCGVAWWLNRRAKARRRETALAFAGAAGVAGGPAGVAAGVAGPAGVAGATGPASEPRSSRIAGTPLFQAKEQWVLSYAEGLTRRLFTGVTEPLTPSVRAKRAGSTRSGALFQRKAAAAGYSKRVSVSAFCEARTRLMLTGALAGALFGAVFSLELAALLGIGGALLGRALPGIALQRSVRERALGAELHLSEMLEVVALGLRSGMTFDRSFALYGAYFDSEFARSCKLAHRRWALGFATREEALRDLAASYECEQLSRVVDSIVRSLRFGSALAGILEEASSQSRVSYRAMLEERVAKAPVKMMLPTGTLILPAMLLLVMGPVLLELAGGFA